MEDKKIYVIGDVHGMHEAMLDILDQAMFDYENDMIISLGDLGDRGPDTWEVIETFLKIKNKVMIRGNHDCWLIKFLKDLLNADSESNTEVTDYWAQNGGLPTVLSYQKNGFKNLRKHLELLESQVPYHVIGNMCFVHGSFERMESIHNQNPDSMCWDRDIAENMMAKGDTPLPNVDGFERIFIGHTPTICWDISEKDGKNNILISNIREMKPINFPLIRRGIVNVDTGSGKKHGGKLTLMDIHSLEYWQSDEQY